MVDLGHTTGPTMAPAPLPCKYLPGISPAHDYTPLASAPANSLEILLSREFLRVLCFPLPLDFALEMNRKRQEGKPHDDQPGRLSKGLRKRCPKRVVLVGTGKSGAEAPRRRVVMAGTGGKRRQTLAGGTVPHCTTGRAGDDRMTACKTDASPGTRHTAAGHPAQLGKPTRQVLTFTFCFKAPTPHPRKEEEAPLGANQPPAPPPSRQPGPAAPGQAAEGLGAPTHGLWAHPQ